MEDKNILLTRTLKYILTLQFKASYVLVNYICMQYKAGVVVSTLPSYAGRCGFESEGESFSRRPVSPLNPNW